MRYNVYLTNTVEIYFFMLYSKIKFEDTKRVSESVSQSTDNTMDKRYQRGIRIRKSKDRHYNGQKKKKKKTTNYWGQNSKQKTNNWPTRTPLKTVNCHNGFNSELRSYGRLILSYYYQSQLKAIFKREAFHIISQNY